jgi:cytoskeletal protein RodZ
MAEPTENSSSGSLPPADQPGPAPTTDPNSGVDESTTPKEDQPTPNADGSPVATNSTNTNSTDSSSPTTGGDAQTSDTSNTRELYIAPGFVDKFEVDEFTLTKTPSSVPADKVDRILEAARDCGVSVEVKE